MYYAAATLLDFTVFEYAYVEFSPWLNVFLGERGTGKTHLLRALYAATAALTEEEMQRKLSGVFCLEHERLSELVRRGRPCSELSVTRIDDVSRDILLSARGGVLIEDDDEEAWRALSVRSAYIASDGHAFLSDPSPLALEAIAAASWLDVLELARKTENTPDAPALRALLEKLKTLGANAKGLRALTPEWLRAAALLWLLLKNGDIQPGSVLFWDLPDFGSDCRLEHAVADFIVEIALTNNQVFVATRSASLLRELDMALANRLKIYDDVVRYIRLFRAEEGAQAAWAGGVAGIGAVAGPEEPVAA